MNINMLGGAHLLRYLGLDAGRFLSQLESFHGQQFGMLQQISDGFHFAAGFTAANQLANMLQSGMIPGQGMMMPPNMACCCCPGQYAQPRMMDFGAMPGAAPFSMPGLFARQQGAMFERALSTNPFMRQQVEMMLGGRISPDGVADGRMMVTPFPPGMMTPGGSPNPSAMAAMDFMSQIMQAASMMGPMNPIGMFNQAMLGALGNLLNGGGANGVGGGNRAGGGSPYVDWNDQPHAPAQGGPTQGAFGIGEGGDASAVLNDPSLTVEDKVTLMLMLIMKKMDKDIEKQANYINDLQQQQQKGGKGGGKGKGGGGSSPSIDVETMKLKRMIDKRSQMFDMLRQIIDKYNETAKNIIQSIGR